MGFLGAGAAGMPRSRIVEALRGYLRENWGSPFVVAFMALLMAAAGFLCTGSEAMANELAVYAYYCLVLGVGLQLACYLRYGGEEE